jgi:hypothetical protein
MSTLSRKMIVFTACFLSLLVGLHFAYAPPTVEAQNTTFLKPPYFGTKPLYAIFDHEYPTRYTQMTPPDVAGSVVNRDGFSYTTGDCFRYTGHAGIDYDLNYDYVLAAHNGTVVEAGWSNPENRRKGLGLRVEIETTITGNTYRTRYGHLSGLVVYTNQTVAQGGVIAMSGNTGNSHGSHLHFEVQKRHVHEDNRVRFYPINPYGWASTNPQRPADPWQNAEDGRPASVNLWQNRPSISAEKCTYATGTAIPPSEAPPFTPNFNNPIRKVVDDNDSLFTYNGPWTQVINCDWEFAECYGGTYRWLRKTTSSPPGTATWSLPLKELVLGDYDVYAYITSNHSDTADAYYHIYHNNKLHSAHIVQSEFNKPGKIRYWAYLGRYDFSNSTNLPVPQRITVHHLGDNFQDIAADAVVLVLADGPPDLNLPITHSYDDAGPNAEQTCGYGVLWWEIYLGHCNEGTGIVSGFRYSNVNIPNNATITRSHLQFTIDVGLPGNPETDLLRLRFYGEDDPESASFYSSPPDDEGRPLTTAWSSWYVPSTDPWVWMPGPPQLRYSPNVGPIVQEIVNHSEWEPGGSALTFIVKPEPGFSSTQHRRIMAYERDQPPPGQYSARLLVWYTCSGSPCPTQ